MSLVDQIADQLRAQGIDPAILHGAGEGVVDTIDARGRGVRVVCVAPNMRDSVDAMGSAPRDQVVMVRVDADTAHRLDAWVETGALRSRSEAAALFIREGLAVRASELATMEGALDSVRAAKDRLRAQARTVLGAESIQPPHGKDRETE